MEGFSGFFRGNAEVLNAIIKEEEALIKAGMTMSSLNDAALVPGLMGESQPDLIGRYLIVSMKAAKVQPQLIDLTRLSVDEKKEIAKQLYSFAEELKSIGQQIGK